MEGDCTSDDFKCLYLPKFEDKFFFSFHFFFSFCRFSFKHFLFNFILIRGLLARIEREKVRSYADILTWISVVV